MNNTKVKLYNLGFCNPIYSWLVSFITDRIQYVKIKKFKSPVYDVSSGIPQGSRPAPLLFNIFVNDIKVTNSCVLLFSDNLKIFCIVNSVNDAIFI